VTYLQRVRSLKLTAPVQLHFRQVSLALSASYQRTSAPSSSSASATHTTHIHNQRTHNMAKESAPAVTDEGFFMAIIEQLGGTNAIDWQVVADKSNIVSKGAA